MHILYSPPKPGQPPLLVGQVWQAGGLGDTQASAYLCWLTSLWACALHHVGLGCRKGSISKGQGRQALGIVSPLCPTAWHSQLAQRQPLLGQRGGSSWVMTPGS